METWEESESLMMFALNQPKDHLIYIDSVNSELHLLWFTAKNIFIDLSSKPALFNKVAIHKCLFKFKFELIKLK